MRHWRVILASLGMAAASVGGCNSSTAPPTAPSMSWEPSSYVVTLSADSLVVLPRESMRLVIRRGGHDFGPLAYANIQSSTTCAGGGTAGVFVGNETPRITNPGAVAQVTFEMTPEVCPIQIYPATIYARGTFTITATSNVDGVPLTATATVKVQ